MTKNTLFLTIFFLVSAFISLISSETAKTLSIDKSCTKIESIFARGSGSKLDEVNSEKQRFFNQVRDRLDNSNITASDYELGTESYGGYQYPAVSISGWGNFTALGASLSAGEFFKYGESVKQGVGELKSYLTQRYDKCKSSNTYYILGGYSQGAQVMGQALPTLPQEIRDKIIFVGLFGDPKLHLPEGEGINPPACRGKDFSPWRRTISSCHLDNGSLTARTPYLPDDMQQKTGLWCYAKDSICDLGALGEMSGHSEYKDEGRAIDEAAREVAERLARVLPTNESSLIDTTKPRGSSTTGTDTVFVIDTTGSMHNIIEQTKAFARVSAEKLKAQNGRVALVEYKDKGDWYSSRILSGFEDDYSTFQSQLDSLFASGGGDFPEATLHALMTAFNGLNWKNGATKAAIVLTDASFHDPDRVDGTTLEAVAKRSLEIDPVNIYPVVTGVAEPYYQTLAEMTSGQVIVDNGNIHEALFTAVTKIQERPVPLLNNIEYKAEPGQEITFNASESYVVDANITKYEWDFDGDGTFDSTTTQPFINHTYPTSFTGNMQVRLTADNDTIASTSAVVTIAPIPTLPPPAAPSGLTHTITKTSNNKSTVTIQWNANTSVDQWHVTINDTHLGYLTGDRTSLQITDVDRTNTVTVGVASHKSGAGTSTFSTTTITPPTTTPSPPVISTCNQSNIFTRILCKAIALLKLIVNGIVHFILPWKV